MSTLMTVCPGDTDQTALSHTHTPQAHKAINHMTAAA